MAASHRGIALLIANSSYPHLGDLGNALNDASAMSCKLQSCNYEILSAINLDIDEIKAKISHLKRRLAVSQHREILIYYAGHGLVHNNEHYIAGGEFNKEAQSLDDEIDLKCLSVDSDIIDSICKISLPEEKNRSFVVILDACREFTNQLNRGMAPGVRLLPPLKPRHEMRIGILVCYACALGLGARDSGKHGLYTDCILQNIFEPGKSIVDAISLANRMAAKRANADQRPVMQVNYTDFFQYALIQGAPATDEPSRTRDHDNKLLETEHEKLKLEKEKVISDSEIMEKIYELTGGAFWTRNKHRLSWQPNKCTFQFKEASARITYISLKENTLTGMIPQEFGRLSYLTYLDLSINKLQGKIPKELGELLNLERLDLHGNQLTGEIPKELGELSNLEALCLENNRLTGAIPMELGKLSELKELHLYSNQLTGAIPLELGKLIELKDLWLGYNQFTGAIPIELGKLSRLERLNLSGNQLIGYLPIIRGCQYVSFHPPRP